MTTRAASDSTGEHRRRRARNSLSREEILAAALALTESDGLPRLSMPVLARRLGCAVMSIYKYFASKDDLLEALAEQVMRDLHRRLPPAGAGPWQAEVLTYFAAYRDLMDDFPAYREVALYAPTAALRGALTPGQLRRLDTGIGLFHRAGLPLEAAASAYNVCYNYTRSYVAFERAVNLSGGDARVDASGEALDPARYPLLAALPDVSAPLTLDEDGFRHGLELLIAGVTALYGLDPEG